MSQQIVKISNFKLNIFRNLLEQSLMVNNQLMLEIGPDMIKSCSFSMTKSFVKLWTIPLGNLIAKPDVSENELKLEGVVEDTQELNFETFNFYILKGDLFKKYLSVHNADMVNLEFIIEENNGKYQAAQIIIHGTAETNSPLVTSFTLTTEDLISNKIDDYSEVIKQCTPSPDMFEFILANEHIQEIKRLIKNLHKSSADNTSFLTFMVDAEKQKIVVNDKVFTIDFSIPEELKESDKFPKESFKFNILKSDFMMTGNHIFSVFTNNREEKVILGANYAGSIIWCLSSKINESNLDSNNNVEEVTMDSLNLDEYLEDI